MCAGADPGIFDGGMGTNFTRYVETVLLLITSIPRQFSVIVHHIPKLQPFRLFDFNRLTDRGYRLSRCHISESRCFCKRRTRLLCEQSRPIECSRKNYKFEQAWYLVGQRSVTQVSFLKINQLIVICDHLVVRISVSSHSNYFILFIFLTGSEVAWGGGGVRTPLTLSLDPPLLHLDSLRSSGRIVLL